MLITSFLIACIVLLRYSLSDDRSSCRCPRETDDVNTPLENVPCQTSIIAYRDRYELSPIIVPKELGRGTGSRCAFYYVMSSLMKFMTTGLAPAIQHLFIQPHVFVSSLSLKRLTLE